MAVDVERFKKLLEEERRRVLDAIEYLHKENPGSIEDETEDETTDNHIAETATATLDREIDYTLEENSEHVLVGDRGGSQSDRRGDVRHVRELRQADRRGAPRSDPVGDVLHRLQATRGGPVNEPAPTRRRLGDAPRGRGASPARPASFDVRVGRPRTR